MEDSSKGTNFMHDIKLDYFLSGQTKEKTDELNERIQNEQKMDTTEPIQQKQ